MRILTRYILGEILSYALIGCALFTFILFVPQLPHILEVVVRNSSTLTNVAEIFLFTLPNLFKVTIPMSVLVGVLLGLSRLAADSEIIAMRASGLGIVYFVRVAAIVAVTGTLLGLANSLYLAPRANQAILEMEQSLGSSQASYEIQPRVFYEDFRNFVLYVGDVRAGAGAANWRQVFMADVSDPANPLITTAASATVVNDNTQQLLMRLRDGARHETSPGQPEQYSISTFSTTDLPLSLSSQSDVHLGRLDTAIYALPLGALARAHPFAEGQPRRQALPDRTAQPFLLSRGLPGADARRRAAGRGLAARRQELGLRSDDPAGFLLLLPLLHRDRAGPSEQARRLFRGLVGQFALRRGGNLSAVADGKRRTDSGRTRRPGHADTHGAARKQSRRGSGWTSGLTGFHPRPQQPAGRAMRFRAFSTNTWCANS